MTKGPAYLGSRAGTESPNTFNETDRELHRKKRKIVSHGISERAMRGFEPEMAHEVDVFLGQLLKSSKSKEVVDMTPVCERLGVDVVGRLAFGFELNSQCDPTHRSVSAGIKGRSRLSSLYLSWPALRFLNPVFTRMSLAKQKRDIQNSYNSLRIMIEARMALPKDAKHDFCARVSGDIAPNEPGLSMKSLWGEAIFLVAAGMWISFSSLQKSFKITSLTIAYTQQVGAPQQRPSQPRSSIFLDTLVCTNGWRPRLEPNFRLEMKSSKVHSSAHAGQ